MSEKFRVALLDLEDFDAFEQRKIINAFSSHIDLFNKWDGEAGAVITPKNTQAVRNICGYSKFHDLNMRVDGVMYNITPISKVDDMNSVMAVVRENERARADKIRIQFDAARTASASRAAMNASMDGLSKSLSFPVLKALKKAARAIILATMFGAATLSMRYLPYNREGDVPAADAAYGIYNTFIPEVIVGTIPLYAVHNIEYGMSDLKIKYRAVGDVFLAHQQGSGRTLRIDGKLVGPYRYMYLAVLLGLQYKGKGSLENINNLTGISAGTLSDGISSVTLTKEEEYEHHATIPVITQTDISLDLYIQTLEWHQTVDTGGEKIVNYSILFRRYVEPDAIQIFDAKKEIVTYGSTLSERLRNEAMIDMFWKTSKIATEVIRVEFFDGKYTNRLNREAVYTDPYISSIQSLTQGAASEMYDGIMDAVGKTVESPPPPPFVTPRG